MRYPRITLVAFAGLALARPLEPRQLSAPQFWSQKECLDAHEPQPSAASAPQPPPAKLEPQQSLPKIVYRGSSKSPEEIRTAGGFIPRDNGPITNETFGLSSHHGGQWRTFYTSTTRSFGIALGFSVGYPDVGYFDGEPRGGWVYRIHPTPNIIDLANSGITFSYDDEEEFSALGGVRYDQIEAWMPMPKNITGRDLTEADILKFHDFENFAKEFPDRKWTDNVDYNHKYDSLSASPGQPQLSGDRDNLAKFNDKTLEQHAIEFMKKNGKAVGWTGTFPLSSLTSGKTSAPNNVDH